MRVLMLTGRQEEFLGGHQVQQRETSRALEKLGVEVSLGTSIDESSLRTVDVVHAWWPDLSEMRKARLRGVPVVASTVYIPVLTMGTPRPATIARKRVRMATALGVQALRGEHIAGAERLLRQRKVLGLLFESADLLLPNSWGEADLIRSELGVSTPCRVVPNAYDPSVFNETGAQPWSARLGVVIAGRVEPHKNQLALIRALSGTGIPLTVVGTAHPSHMSYYERCARASRRTENVSLLGGVDQGRLAELFRASRVHALPSEWETTGLVSLEAAACGCNIAVSDRGHVREYLGDDAWYCDPNDIETIRAAVTAAHEGPQQRALLASIHATKTWAHAAEATLEAYREAIRMKRVIDAD